MLKDCVLGDLNSDISIVLLGDSKAQQWMPVLSDIGIKNGWKIIPIIKAGCPPVYVDIYLGYLGREYRECNQWRDLAINAILEQEPALILLSHYAGYGFVTGGRKSPATVHGWQEGYRKFGEKLASANSKLLYLRDNPQFPMEVPNCLSREVGGGDISESMCELAISKVQTREAIYKVAVMALEQLDDVQFLDLTEKYCPDGLCPAYYNGVVRYTDQHHLSLDFTQELSFTIEHRLLLMLENQ
jgi:hypothetical protein